MVDSSPFTVVVTATIAVNAVLLGLQTYEGLERRWGRTLDALAVCLAVFVVELLLRLGAYWPRPWDFFRSGWNVFDVVVVAATFVPGIRQNSTLLRLVRLLRVIRIVRVLPDLRVLLLGVWRSIPPLASIGAVTAMILFVYGMAAGSSSRTGCPSSGGTSAGRCSKPSPIDPEALAHVAERIAILRSALDELELELAVGPVHDERAPT